MSTEVAHSGIARSRTTTRTSIRQSLGKAFADVMHKDAADKEKEKSTKTVRRGSAMQISQPMSVRGEKPTSATSTISKKGEPGRSASPEVKEKVPMRSSRRLAALKKPAPSLSSDERSSSSPNLLAPKAGLPRSSTLRPKASAAASALPKYRPRSLVGEPPSGKQSPSQSVRTRSPARSSDSSDDTEDVQKKKDFSSRVLRPSANTANRSISPVPHKGALQVDLSTAIRVSPATPERKSNHSTPTHTPSPSHGTLRAKTHKPLPSITGARNVITRPPSSSSSSASPQTPKSMKTASAPSTGHRRTGSTAGREHSPVRGSPKRAQESPLGRVTDRRTVRGPSAARLQQAPSTTPSSSQSADDSMDSVEAELVENMLSTVISPTAPTPTLPRFRTTAPSDSESPHTPSRSFLPSGVNLSFLTPTADSPFLRPNGTMSIADRGSILSWEQLAKHNNEFSGDDMLHMISEVPAPFRSGAASPSPSTIALELPESPMLSALPSPTSYGSISQVLLPDVTPSPAMHSVPLKYSRLDEDAALHTDSTVTQLRLQLAAAESKARESFVQIESLENQLESVKEAHMRDRSGLSKQIQELEGRVHGNLQVDERRLEYISSLEDQLRAAQAQRERAVQDVRAQQQAIVQNAIAQAIRGLGMKFSLANAAHEARSSWQSVRDTAESELELIRANREMLAVLSAGLAQNRL